MTELMLVLQVISGIRIAVTEGLSTINAIKEYTTKSETLSTADKTLILAQIDEIDKAVQDSKFTDEEIKTDSVIV